MPDRRDDNIIWVSGSSNVEHIDMRTGILQGTTPFPRRQGGGGGRERPPVADRQYRRNWAIPLAISPHDPRKVYVGSQYVHQSPDGGETWSVISPDLTTNDKSKQQVPLDFHDRVTQDVPCTLIYIEESPIEPGVIWTGSNDGVVSLTRDGGKTWTNVTANIPVATWGWVYSIAPSRHAFGTAYVTFDRHRAADTSTYVFKTEDYGRTWKSIGSGIPTSVFAYARVVREDPRRKGMLYLGTENSLHLTVDDGATWLPLQNNLPHSPIAWLTVQEDFDDLVVATWGRGVLDPRRHRAAATADAVGARLAGASVRAAGGVPVRLARSNNELELPDRERSAVARRPQPAVWRGDHLLPEHACVERGSSDHSRRHGHDDPDAERHPGVRSEPRVVGSPLDRAPRRRHQPVVTRRSVRHKAPDVTRRIRW